MFFGFGTYSTLTHRLMKAETNFLFTERSSGDPFEVESGDFIIHLPTEDFISE